MMKEQEQRQQAAAQGGAVKPGKPASEAARWLEDAIEDDEVREALRVPHQHKPATQGGA